MSSRINVASASGSGSTTLQTTPGVSHSLGNLLIAVVGWEDQGNLDGFSDLAGNTWNKLTQYPASPLPANICAGWAIVTNAHASNQVTATWATSSLFARLAVIQYDLTSAAFDAENGGASGTSADPMPTGSITLNQDNEVVVAAGKGYAFQSPWTPPSGWTEVIEIPNEFAVNEKLDAPSGSISTTVDPTGESAWAALIAAFEPSTPPPSPAIFMRYNEFPKFVLRRRF